MKNEYLSNDIKFFLSENEKKPTQPPCYLISEYIEGRRILPPGTPFPGFWENSKTPYSVEIMDNMSPFNSIQHTAVMKGAQLGLTAAAENVIAYWMDENPAEVMYISATEILLEKWAIKRLDPLIDSCGFRDKIYAQTENRHSKRTGDKTFIKEFVGGTLDMASAQAAGSLRSSTKRILVRDEIDGAPMMLRTGEGNWLEVSFARTNAWGARRKVLDFSTPTIVGESPIWDQYEAGDKRKYLVPCPHCGSYQEIEWTGEQSTHGMHADFEAGKLTKVYYICEKCHDPIFNHHKNYMLPKGRWEPTAISSSDVYRSYHISSLYSPTGMLSWFELYEKYLKARDNPDGMRSFTNLYLGLPYQEKGARPKLENVIELRGLYKQKTVPQGVLFLTAGIDVQRGSAKNPDNPPRLEIEVLGHGAGYRSWSVDYQVIEGPVEDGYSGSWEKLNEMALAGGLKFYRDDGMLFEPSLIFIDSGDGNVTDVVYHFCTRWRNTFPSKGFSALKKRKGEKTDDEGPANFRRYRAIKVGEGETILYEISTNYYKNIVYRNLKIPRQEVDAQKPGFCDFPLQYGEKYFAMLISEEKRSDGSYFCPQGRRNEALDCRVMNLCAHDVYLEAQVAKLRAAAKQGGANALQLQQITRKNVIEYLTKQTARRM